MVSVCKVTHIQVLMLQAIHTAVCVGFACYYNQPYKTSSDSFDSIPSHIGLKTLNATSFLNGNSHANVKPLSDSSFLVQIG